MKAENEDSVATKKKKRFLTMTQMAEEVCVSPPTIKKWDDEGVIQSIKVPGTKRRLYNLEEVLETLNALKS